VNLLHKCLLLSLVLISAAVVRAHLQILQGEAEEVSVAIIIMALDVGEQAEDAVCQPLDEVIRDSAPAKVDAWATILITLSVKSASSMAILLIDAGIGSMKSLFPNRHMAAAATRSYMVDTN
jgi:hypothetical protein